MQGKIFVSRARLQLHVTASADLHSAPGEVPAPRASRDQALQLSSEQPGKPRRNSGGLFIFRAKNYLCCFWKVQWDF